MYREIRERRSSTPRTGCASTNALRPCPATYSRIRKWRSGPCAPSSNVRTMLGWLSCRCYPHCVAESHQNLFRLNRQLSEKFNLIRGRTLKAFGPLRLPSEDCLGRTRSPDVGLTEAATRRHSRIGINSLQGVCNRIAARMILRFPPGRPITGTVFRESGGIFERES